MLKSTTIKKNVCSYNLWLVNMINIFPKSKKNILRERADVLKWWIILLLLLYFGTSKCFVFQIALNI